MIILAAITLYSNATSQTTAQLDGKARDAAVYDRARQIKDATQGGITILGKNTHDFDWNGNTITVGVQLGTCRVGGALTSPIHPSNAGQLSNLIIILPGETINRRARDNTLIPLDPASPKDAYAAIRATPYGHCIAGDQRFQP